MLTVHHLNNSRSQRILWLLEELGLPYEIVKYQRMQGIPLAPPELKAVHPLGKSPVVTDGGRTIAESGAIIEYVLDTYGKGRLKPGPGTDAYWEYVEWMHFAEGSAMLPLLMALYASLLGDGAAMLRPRIDSEIANHLSYMEARLGDRAFFVGDELTGADVQLLFVLEAAGARLEGYPKLVAYRDRMHARPAYQRGIERGGPYQLMSR
jgi:glutathione S-transferase